MGRRRLGLVTRLVEQLGGPPALLGPAVTGSGTATATARACQHAAPPVAPPQPLAAARLPLGLCAVPSAALCGAATLVRRSGALPHPSPLLLLLLCPGLGAGGAARSLSAAGAGGGGGGGGSGASMGGAAGGSDEGSGSSSGVGGVGTRSSGTSLGVRGAPTDAFAAAAAPAEPLLAVAAAEMSTPTDQTEQAAAEAALAASLEETAALGAAEAHAAAVAGPTGIPSRPAAAAARPDRAAAAAIADAPCAALPPPLPPLPDPPPVLFPLLDEVERRYRPIAATASGWALREAAMVLLRIEGGSQEARAAEARAREGGAREAGETGKEAAAKAAGKEAGAEGAGAVEAALDDLRTLGGLHRRLKQQWQLQAASAQPAPGPAVGRFLLCSLLHNDVLFVLTPPPAATAASDFGVRRVDLLPAVLAAGKYGRQTAAQVAAAHLAERVGTQPVAQGRPDRVPRLAAAASRSREALRSSPPLPSELPAVLAVLERRYPQPRSRQTVFTYHVARLLLRAAGASGGEQRQLTSKETGAREEEPLAAAAAAAAAATCARSGAATATGAAAGEGPHRPEVLILDRLRSRNDPGLERLVAHLRVVSHVAVDTERAGWEVVLLQLAAPATASFPRTAYVLDLHGAHLTDRMRIMGALAPALTSPHLVKVLHGAQQDVRSLRNSFGIQLGPLVDTQEVYSCLMAAWAGAPYFCKRQLTQSSAGLSHVLEAVGLRHEHKEHFKGMYRSNPNLWLERPLSAAMVEYAVQDVAPLLDTYRALLRHLLTHPSAQPPFLMQPSRHLEVAAVPQLRDMVDRRRLEGLAAEEGGAAGRR
ncbi:hypothetical protein TSOC_004631 [Tetrabaena socialis]|uniref:3'-5' exonuclease domain-containing protein n=1 Tax=Tetrabaena socialis TaxID=47790 RepID=A0A2J8A8C3_9CHLO|nr:hypothetical protein TSOC_004631 [Tetrabaena socialis]|eukprot:PNH08782.1 hypothetical protein TSOC_004631 [Tetrabaena socialis]